MIAYKNLLFENSLSYLQKATPHRLWHYGLMLIALIVAATFFSREFDEWTIRSLQMMAVPILSIYWFFQFRVMQSAVRLSQRDSQSELPDELVGTVSQRTVVLANIRAVLWHYRYFIIFMTLVLLGLSLAISGFLLFHGGYSTILRYVGVVHTGVGPMRENYPFSLSDKMIYAGWIGIALLVLTVANTFFSLCLGLWVSNLRSAVTLRLLLLIIVFGLFFTLHSVRQIPPWSCGRAYWQSDPCPGIYHQQLLMDSFQAVTLSFIDGGTSMVTGLHGCSFLVFRWNGYQGRHLMAIATTIAIQLAMSGFFLWRSSCLQYKKKTA